MSRKSQAFDIHVERHCRQTDARELVQKPTSGNKLAVFEGHKEGNSKRIVRRGGDSKK